MTDAMHPSIRRARQLARLLDSAFHIPVINKKIGLDPILGAVPVAGDLVTALLSCYPIWIAYQLGFPRHIILKLVLNVMFDTAISLIPVYGDIADAFWKSNMRNVELLEEAFKTHGARVIRDGGRPGGAIIDVQAESS